MVEFIEGVIVQLKSGGPKMTVYSVDSKFTASVFCQWFSGSKLESGSFNPGSLIIIKEERDK